MEGIKAFGILFGHKFEFFKSWVFSLNATETNRKRGTGTREKVRSKRINLEGNTHAQEINVSQYPV
jgi:hypothetical protein